MSSPTDEVNGSLARIWPSRLRAAVPPGRDPL